MPETPKNWRPTSLVFTGNPETREDLADYALWLEGGRGIVFLANVLVGPFEKYGKHRATALEQLRDFCDKRDMQAFPVVLVDEDLDHGMSSLLQTLSIGPVRPNLAVFGWSDAHERVAGYVGQLRMAEAMGMSLVLLEAGTRVFHTGHKRVDIWWRGMKNGGLMMLLAHLLTRNWEWSRTEVRLLRLVDKEEARTSTREDLQRLVGDARMEASVAVVVDEAPFAEVLRRESGDADCVFLGFETPEEGSEQEWRSRYEPLLLEAPTIILVCSVGAEDLMA